MENASFNLEKIITCKSASQLIFKYQVINVCYTDNWAECLGSGDYLFPITNWKQYKTSYLTLNFETKLQAGSIMKKEKLKL